MKEKREFDNIANLIRVKRRSLSPKVSQQDLSYKLGYKNGQFISNIERGLCSVPLRSLGTICEILNVSKEELRQTLLNDYAQTLDNYFNDSAEMNAQEEENVVAQNSERTQSAPSEAMRAVYTF